MTDDEIREIVKKRQEQFFADLAAAQKWMDDEDRAIREMLLKATQQKAEK